MPASDNELNTLVELESILAHELITVTDIPTGATGRYEFRPSDEMALRDYQSAGIRGNGFANRASWYKLALSVATSRVARCHGCAAYAAHRVSSYVRRNNLHSYIAGIKSSDHHVLIVTEQNNIPAGVLRTPLSQFATVVDLWMYNVLRQTSGSLDKTALCNYVVYHNYTRHSPEIRVFAQYQ